MFKNIQPKPRSESFSNESILQQKGQGFAVIRLKYQFPNSKKWQKRKMCRRWKIVFRKIENIEGYPLIPFGLMNRVSHKHGV